MYSVVSISQHYVFNMGRCAAPCCSNGSTKNRDPSKFSLHTVRKKDPPGTEAAWWRWLNNCRMVSEIYLHLSRTLVALLVSFCALEKLS